MDNISDDLKKNLSSLISEGYILNDPRFTHVNRWSYIAIQLFEALNFLELAKNTEKYEKKLSMNEVLLQQALFRSAIISYAKCFPSSGKGRMSLNKKKIFKQEPEKLLIHERIMNIRNEFAAHNGNSEMDQAVLAVKETENEILIKHTYTISSPLSEFDSFAGIIKFVESSVIIKINLALDSIQSKEDKAVILAR